MRKTVKVASCNNHLSALFEALQHEDTQAVEVIEHKLTSEELCVACSYLLRVKGSARDVFEVYLAHRGFVPRDPSQHPIGNISVFLLTRLLLFLAAIVLSYTTLTLLKLFFFGEKAAGALNPFEIIAIFVLGIVLFLTVDDRYLD